MDTTTSRVAFATLAIFGCQDANLGQRVLQEQNLALQDRHRPASHNTYDDDHTPPNEDVTWHFVQNDDLTGDAGLPNPIATKDIELDLVDVMDALHIPDGETEDDLDGDWWVSHASDVDVTVHCGGHGKLSDCLDAIALYHGNRPEHPLISIWLDKKNAWNEELRSPADLDTLIASKIDVSDLFRPTDISGTGTLRERIQASGWPIHDDLDGRVMFVLTADNTNLDFYAEDREWDANAFVAPSAVSESDVLDSPEDFTSGNWAVIYNFEWQSDDPGNPCSEVTCEYVSTAVGEDFLTRIWGIEDQGEWTASHNQDGNYFAIDCPWLDNGDQYDCGQ